MAKGSYTPIYRDYILQLLEAHDVVVLHTMLTLAQHCSHLGTCYVGQIKLKQYIHRTWPVIVDALFELSDRDWIRVIHLDQMGMVGIGYQISPELVYIRDSCVEQAEAIWASAMPLHASERFLSLKDVTLVHTTRYLTRGETTTETNRETNRETIIISHNDAENDGPIYIDPPQGKGKGKKTGTARSSESARSATTARSAISTARSARADTPPSSAAPPQDMTPWKTPLADDLAETMAHLIAQTYHTRLSQARQLIDRYGVDAVRKAQAYIQAKRVAGQNVRNPMGLMMTWLRSNAISAADSPPSPSPSDDETQEGTADPRSLYLSGDLAAYIEH